MSNPVFGLLALYGLVSAGAHASSFGYAGAADIAKVGESPAICLPHDASGQARDTYTAVFCIRERAQGTREYLQLPLLAEAPVVPPPCDTRHDRNYK